jgi:hypothetical protein
VLIIIVKRLKIMIKRINCLICNKEIIEGNLGGLAYGTGSIYSPLKRLCGDCYHKGKEKEAEEKAFKIDYELTKKINKW